MAIDATLEPAATGWARAEPPGSSTIGLPVLTVMVVVLAILTWWAFSVPGAYFLIAMFLPWPWLLAGAFWLVAASVVLGRTGFRATVRNGWLVGMAAIVVATAAGVMAAAPLRIRFELSRASLDAMTAQMVPPQGSNVRPDQWIGAFDAERIERFPGGYRFLVKGTGFLDPVGLAYSPDGSPPDLGGEDRYEPFDGSWWIWVESW